MTWGKAMSLREMLGQRNGLAVAARPEGQDEIRDGALQDLKGRVHYKVIEQLDLAILGESTSEVAEKELENAVGLVLDSEPDLSPGRSGTISSTR